MRGQPDQADATAMTLLGCRPAAGLPLKRADGRLRAPQSLQSVDDIVKTAV
jgi:hypothetical protein